MRRFRKSWWAVAALLLLAAPYLVAGREPRMFEEGAPRGAGDVVTLTRGATYYEIVGREEREDITVLVHGTTVPSFVWDKNVTVLAAAGLRVLRYDLYGRGRSDRVEGAYDLGLFVDQLTDLVDRVAPGRPLNLVGVSLGGLIIAEYALRHPRRVATLVFVDPAGVGTELPLVGKVALMPGIGEYVFRVAGTKQLPPTRRMLEHPERFENLDSIYLEQLAVRGSRRAVLSTLRNVSFTGYEDRFAAVGRTGIPTLLVWGENDKIVPHSNAEVVRQLMGAREFLSVKSAGHFPNIDQPDLFNRSVIQFIERHAARTVQ